MKALFLVPNITVHHFSKETTFIFQTIRKQISHLKT